MTLLTKRKPVQVPSIFSDFFDGDSFLNWDVPVVKGMGVASRIPATNIRDEEQQYVIELAAPGLQKDDFSVEVENNRLVVSSEKEESTEEEQDNYVRNEFRYDAFKRTFTLPDSVDIEKIDAEYNNGILTVYLPKVEVTKSNAKKAIKVS